MKFVKYSNNLKNEWDAFIRSSKNSHFIFFRDYLEYHHNRFEDYSFLIYNNKNILISIFPANIDKDIVISHGGLTFGGFVTNSEMTVFSMLEIFKDFIEILKESSIKNLIYKSIPYIYCSLNSEEDRYALFKYKAKLFRRDVSSSITFKNSIQYKELRKRGIKKEVNWV